MVVVIASVRATETASPRDQSETVEMNRRPPPSKSDRSATPSDPSESPRRDPPPSRH